MYFSEGELVKCGNKLAAQLNLPEPPESELRSKISEILVERNNYNGAIEGLITKDEIASLVLQHFQTLICSHANVSESKVNISWESVIPDTIEALFKYENA